MRLNARMLKNVTDVNHWEYAREAHIQEGQTNEFYLQLVDVDQVPDEEIKKSIPLPDFPLRYIPQGTTITLELTFPDLNTDNNIVVDATQPFSDDLSIFKVTLNSLQTPHSGSVKARLTIDGVDKYFLMNNVIVTDLLEVGDC